MYPENAPDMRKVAIITDLGDDYYQVTWYYEKGGAQAVHTFPKAGVRTTLRNIEILLSHGYPVEPKDLLERLQSTQEESRDRD
jgi:hypothetical protein